MRIRRAKTADFLAIAALDRVAWRANRHGEFIPDGEHVWRIWCEYALVFVAHDGDVRGVILAFPCVSGTFCLHKVFVDAHVRGRGVATRLFQRLLAETDAHGVGCFLTVDPANEAALRLYRAWGFRLSSRVRGFYRPGEDRLVLVRRPPGR